MTRRSYIPWKRRLEKKLKSVVDIINLAAEERRLVAGGCLADRHGPGA